MPIQSREVADRDPHPAGLTCDLETTSIGQVRQLVRGLLDGHHGVHLDDAVLVVDELVSNAIQHGKGPRSCRLAPFDDGRGLRIEVSDAGPAPPRLRTPDSTGGRGLVLVNKLARAWGVHWYRDHKTVWAELVAHSRRPPHLSVAQPWQS